MGADRPCVTVLQGPLITADTVRQAAAQLEIPVENGSLHLLGFASLLLRLRLPTFWKHVVDEHGNVLYLDNRTLQTTTKHPLSKRLRHIRQQLSLLTSDDSAQQTCMQFKREDGSCYYYNFAESKEMETEPPLEMIIPLLGEDILAGTCLAPPEDIAAIKVLRFYSWWYEDFESTDLTFRVSVVSVGGGLKRRYVVVEYDIANQSFTMRTMNEDQELVVNNLLGVTSKAGSTVDVWDLHVGATLEILGRTVALMKADLDTCKWNVYHSSRLKKLKSQLQQELQKYKPRSHANVLTHDRGDRTVGGLSLRYLVNQVNTLIDDLKQYRPQQAEVYRAAIKIAA